MSWNGCTDFSKTTTPSMSGNMRLPRRWYALFPADTRNNIKISRQLHGENKNQRVQTIRLGFRSGNSGIRMTSPFLMAPGQSSIAIAHTSLSRVPPRNIPRLSGPEEKRLFIRFCRTVCHAVSCNVRREREAHHAIRLPQYVPFPEQ